MSRYLFPESCQNEREREREVRMYEIPKEDFNSKMEGNQQIPKHNFPENGTGTLTGQ